MANFCDFDMHIAGSKSGVEELIAMLSHKGDFKEDGLGRIFDLDVVEFEETQISGVYEATCGGDCAWSIKSSMRDDGIRERSLESESERLGLVVEVFSSEPGNGFQEHLLIVKGEVVVDDCVDYKEHWIGGSASLEEYNRKNDTDFTPDMVNEDGDVCIGGFGDEYAVFEDMSHYFVEEKIVAPLNEQIREAEEQIDNNKRFSDLKLDEKELNI